jgi:hypothetical protein
MMSSTTTLTLNDVESQVIRFMKNVDPLATVERIGRWLRRVVLPSSDNGLEVWFGREWISILRVNPISGLVTDVYLGRPQKQQVA